MRRALAVAWAVALTSCGTGAAVTAHDASSPRPLAHWKAFAHVTRPLDLAGPRADGSLALAAAGRLWLLKPSGAVQPFAPAYKSPGGEEAYIGLVPRTPAALGCFGLGAVYALKVPGPHGLLKIGPGNHVRRFVTLSAKGLEDGITFDQVGDFGHRLLVTINNGSRTTVDAIDCHGHVRTITRNAPRVEGGIVVAPRGFGRFGGDLIASGEVSGKVFAISPQGKTELVADSGLPHGGDIGVESEAFLPDDPPGSMLLADRLTPGNPHPGDDVVLRVTNKSLLGAGARAGDLIVATEGGAKTDAIRCTRSGCQVMHVADGPSIAHAEGHIGLLRGS
ncbi:MAG: hypothetical protein ACXVHB_05655 [Solirubrobacteraceae bacterium]